MKPLNIISKSVGEFVTIASSYETYIGESEIRVKIPRDTQLKLVGLVETEDYDECAVIMDGIYYGVSNNRRQIMYALVELFNPVTGHAETATVNPWELSKDSLKQYELLSSNEEYLKHLTDALESNNVALAKAISAHLSKGRAS